MTQAITTENLTAAGYGVTEGTLSDGTPGWSWTLRGEVWGEQLTEHEAWANAAEHFASTQPYFCPTCGTAGTCWYCQVGW
jgi:hypothetical protein